MGRKSIYICDDHQLFLESFEIFFSLQEKYFCIGHSDNPGEAKKDIDNLKPDIVLIDYHLNTSNGLELIEILKQIHPSAYYFMLTMRRDANLRNRCLELGANGYLLKTIGAEKMINAFDSILSNTILFYDSLAHISLDVSGNKKKHLTERELEIARMVCWEYSSERIASELNLSLHTVHTHRKNILRKLDAKNAIDLMNYLKSLGE
jgi:two-component system nitrate/nitrite response regulator NarL